VSQNARNLALLLGLAALVGALAHGLARRTTGPHGLLEGAPERAVVLAELNVPALRASALFRSLTGETSTGLDHVRDACGLDMLDSLERVEVYVLGEGDGPNGRGEALDEVAFLARGPLDPEALARCLAEVVADDGGGVHRTTIEGAEAIASDQGLGVAAALGQDGFVAGSEVVVAELLRIDAGTSTGLRRDDVLERLYRRTARDGAGAPAHVRLLARLPQAWRQLLGRIGRVGVEGLSLEQTEALGLGLSVTDGVSLSLAFGLESQGAASSAARALEERISEARRAPELAESALAVALAHVELESEGPDLLVRADLARPELDATLALARRLLAAERRSDAGAPDADEADAQPEW
jgi:hypothetical protein